MAVLPTSQEKTKTGPDGSLDPAARGPVFFLRHPLALLPQPRHAVAVLGNFLKPEIFTRRRSPSPAASHRATTAYLDGLRGWAALLVCFVHLAVYTHQDVELCYHHEVFPDVFIDSPVLLPFVRLLFSGGHFSVALFFCISGYVLTQRLIRLLHEDRKDDFVRSVHSAIFRRPLRVFLPVVWSTFIFATFWHVTGLATPWPKREPNLLLEYWSWLLETTHFMFVFKSGFLFSYYNVHTWTIPVELRGSLFLFVWLFLWSHVPHRPRILMTVANIVHLLFFSSGALYAMFFVGMLTAELHLLYAEDRAVQVSLPWNGFLRVLWRHPFFYALLMHLLLVAGLFLASQPTGNGKLIGNEATVEELLGKCNGWQTLRLMIPRAYDKTNFRWFWFFWGAWAVMICAREVRWLRWCLETNFSQYLGRHSFALYLVHGPMIGLVSERLFWLTGVWKEADVFFGDEENYKKFGHLHNKWLNSDWFPFSAEGPMGLEPNFLFCVAISVVVFMYVAELGTKAFDTPSVAVSRWAYKKSKELR